MAGIGLAYKTPEQDAAATFDANARAVTQPPASPGIGMAKISPMADPADVDPNVTPVPDGAPAPALEAPAPLPTASAPAQQPLIDFNKDPAGAIGLFLSSVAAGIDGKASPVEEMRKNQLEQQAQQYRTASLALDVVDKTAAYVSKVPPDQRKSVIADLDARFSPALGGHSIAGFLTALTAGDDAKTAATMQALREIHPSPAMMAYFSKNPKAAIDFLDKYNEHKATAETPAEAGAKAGAVAEAQNAAGATKPMTPAEKAAHNIAAANAGTSAASLKEAVRHNAVEERQSANKPLTDAQSNAAMFADRAHEAEDVLTKHGRELTSSKGRVLDNVPGGNYGQGKNYQLASQAKTNFLMAVLRKESGAAISKDEIATGDQQYFPQPGDSQAVINQKAANRATAMAGLSRAAGPTYKAPAAIIKYDAHGNRIE